MTLEITACARIPEDQPIAIWDDILSKQQTYSFFQTPLWSEILCQTIPESRSYHHWFSFSDGTEAVLPTIAIPKRLGFQKVESLPWGTYGDLIGSGPIGIEHRIAAASQLISWRVPVAEINLPPATSTLDESKLSRLGWRVRTATTHLLPLDEPFDTIWAKRFKSRNRTAIRNAQKKGITVRLSNDLDSLDSLKRLYRAACEKWTGIETPPERFFDMLLDRSGDAIRIWLAEKDNAVRSASVIFYGKGDVQYFAGASDRNSSDNNGSKLLMSEIIRDAVERRYTSFNFGGSGGASGIEQFKERFGAKKVNYFRLNLMHPVVRLFKR